jgi:transcriptional regulator with XRE-family HTH domain
MTTVTYMDEITSPGGEAPTWTLGDRLRKSANLAGLNITAMAEYLGVTRQTVSAWIQGHRTPGPMALRLWAVRTGVPLEWLTEGDEWAPRDSNAQPTGYETEAGA